MPPHRASAGDRVHTLDEIDGVGEDLIVGGMRMPLEKVRGAARGTSCDRVEVQGAMQRRPPFEHCIVLDGAWV